MTTIMIMVMTMIMTAILIMAMIMIMIVMIIKIMSMTIRLPINSDLKINNEHDKYTNPPSSRRRLRRHPKIPGRAPAPTSPTPPAPAVCWH